MNIKMAVVCIMIVLSVSVLVFANTMNKPVSLFSSECGFIDLTLNDSQFVFTGVLITCDSNLFGILGIVVVTYPDTILDLYPVNQRALSGSVSTCVKEWFAVFVSQAAFQQVLDRLAPSLIMAVCSDGRVFFISLSVEQKQRLQNYFGLGNNKV